MTDGVPEMRSGAVRPDFTEPVSPLLLGIVADFPEERWESMDLVAEMVSAEFSGRPEAGIVPVPLTPPYRPIFGRYSGKRLAWNLDRLINRRWTLPRGIRQAIRRELPDAVFVVDHSYAHVVPVIRSEGVPVVVMCHDLDAFRDLFDSAAHGWRAWPRRRFARPILEGLLQADRVVTGSNVVHDEFLARYDGRFPADRVTTIPYGVAPEFLAESTGVAWPIQGLGDATGPLLLHVGSTIPRKRIDVLLEAFAGVIANCPGATLIRVGGRLTDEQRAMAGRVGVEASIREMPRLKREEIAELYRRADVVMVTSDAEGFGLPVAEALACGAEVVASDIPVLRETGGKCVTYATKGDPAAFARAVQDVLAGQGGASRADSAERRAWVARYRWDPFARELAEVMRNAIP